MSGDGMKREVEGEGSRGGHERIERGEGGGKRGV